MNNPCFLCVPARLTSVMLVLFWYLLFCYVSTVHSVVVGVDFGSELFKIGTVSPGRPLEIVLNVYSKRKTPSAVSFVGKTRELGEVALGDTVKEPSDVLMLSPALLGLNPSSNSNSIESIRGPFFPIDIVSDEDRGTIAVHLKRRNATLFPEEVAANLIQLIVRTIRVSLLAQKLHIQDSLVRKACLKTVTVDIVSLSGCQPQDFQPTSKETEIDAVFTVPAGFSMRQRQALLDSASIAGVNVLGFVRETPAAALYHAQDLPQNFTGSKLFINVGAWRTQACVVDYNITAVKLHQQKTSTTVVYCDETDKVGGRHFDIELANLIANRAKDHFKTENLSPPALQQILRQAQKSKLSLSIMKKSEIFLEGLHGGEDFHLTVTRQELEGLIEPLLPSIHTLVETVLKESNITKEGLKGTEIIGGGWRVPRVQQEIENIVKPHTLGQCINGDEGAALGATFVAANASSAFRIENSKFLDPSGFGYTVRLKGASEKGTEHDWKTKEIIKKGGRFGGFRTLSTRGCQDIMAELVEVNKTGAETILTKYNVTGIREACEVNHKDHGLAKISFVFSVTPTGIVILEKVVAQWEESYLAPQLEAQTTMPPPTTSVPRTIEGSGSNVTKEESVPSASSSGTVSPKSTEKPQMVERKRKHSMKCTVIATETLPRPMTSEELRKAKERLAEFESIDMDAMKLAKARNSLESFVYKCRSDLNTKEIIEVSTEESRERLRTQLLETEEWIYEDDESNVPMEEFEKRLQMLKEEFSPMASRAAEVDFRSVLTEAVASMAKKIQQALSPALTDKIELNSTRVEKFQAQWKEFFAWFHAKNEEQEKKTLMDEPAFRGAEVSEKLQEISKDFESLIKSARVKNLNEPTEKNNSSSTTAATTIEGTTKVTSQNDTIAKNRSNAKGSSKESKPSDEL